MSTSPLTWAISVRRSSPYFSFRASSSSVTMASTLASSARMAVQSAIFLFSSSSSFSILRISRPAKRPRGNLQMASAWGSSKPNLAMMAAFASA